MVKKGCSGCGGRRDEVNKMRKCCGAYLRVKVMTYEGKRKLVKVCNVCGRQFPV